MKVVKFDEFNKMPKGTMFCPVSADNVIGEWEIKVSDPFPISNPGELFFNGVVSLHPWNIYDIIQAVEGWEEKASWESYDGDSNDYSEYPMFVILDKEDMKELVKVLNWAIDGCEGEVS